MTAVEAMAGGWRVAAVILAAGRSRRLGRPKQEVVLGGKTLLERAMQTAVEAGFWPVLVVVRPDAGVDVAGLPVTVLENHEAAEGMSTSVRVGVRRAIQAGVGGVVLLTCDQPLLEAAHLRRLVAEPDRVTASAYGGRHGVPAYFPAASFPQLLELTGDRGARDLLAGAWAIPNEALALDIDAEADLRDAERHYQTKGTTT